MDPTAVRDPPESLPALEAHRRRRHRHAWSMAVDAEHPHRPGYELKLNSYDLGVDIELADAIQRLRFEHPEVQVRRGHGRPRPRLLLRREHLHARAVDPLVQGELLQVHQRDAALPRGRQRRTAGSALARRAATAPPPAAATSSRSRATRSSSSTTATPRCRFPETPLLARAPRHRRPHAPGRQAQGPPRSRRRLLHDGRGHQGQAREGLGPRRRTSCRAASSTRRSPTRAKALAGDSQTVDARPGGRRSPPLDAEGRRDDGARRTSYVDARRSIAPRAPPTLTMHGPRRRAADADGCDAPAPRCGRCARSASSTTRSCACASTTPRSAWSPCAPPAIAAPGARPRRARSRRRRPASPARSACSSAACSSASTSPRAASSPSPTPPTAASPASLLELALAADRFYMLIDGDEKVGRARPRVANAGFCPMSTGLSRLETRFFGEPGAGRARSSRAAPTVRSPPRRPSSSASSPSPPTTSTGTTSCASPSRSARRCRPTRSPAWRQSLRFAGPETLETKIFGRLSAWQNWIFTRANATGEHGALTLYGQPERPQFDWTRT